MILHGATLPSSYTICFMSLHGVMQRADFAWRCVLIVYFTWYNATIKQGDSDCEVIVYFRTKFKLSVDLTVIESYNGFGIHLMSLS